MKETRLKLNIKLLIIKRIIYFSHQIFFNFGKHENSMFYLQKEFLLWFLFIKKKLLNKREQRGDGNWKLICIYCPKIMFQRTKRSTNSDPLNSHECHKSKYLTGTIFYKFWRFFFRILALRTQFKNDSFRVSSTAISILIYALKKKWDFFCGIILMIGYEMAKEIAFKRRAYVMIYTVECLGLKL